MQMLEELFSNDFEFDSDVYHSGDDIRQELFDADDDGIVDTFIVTSDTNGDGEADMITMQQDTTGDGMPDLSLNAIDTDKNGVFDTFSVQQDTTGDGRMDIVHKMNDYNQDGNVESVLSYQDLNGDGSYDVRVKLYDSSKDGIIDRVEVAVDQDGDGRPDSKDEYDYSSLASGGTLQPEAIGNDAGGTYAKELETFDPNASVLDRVSGDPATSMGLWEFQGDSQRCALYSQKFVIEEMTKQQIDIEEFADLAESAGWFSESGGTPFLCMDHMLSLYGVPHEMSFHNTIDDLEKCLDNGGKAIVSIDADQIWFGSDYNLFSPESGANHAVEVIGIDRTDPANPMVVLNDSGSPNGRGSCIPKNVFEDTWASGNCQMIECYPC